MVKVLSYSKTGTKREADFMLDKTVFEAEANHELISQAYRAYQANGRATSATTLTRGLVRGGGRKPWRQKGTGRARVGSIRVPNWRGGGITFGPSGNENYAINLPIKAKRQAIRQALSLQAADKKIIVLEGFATKDNKVKETAALLGKLKVEGTIVLVVDVKTPEIIRATRNLAGLTVASANYLNVFMILNADWIVMTEAAVEATKQWLAKDTAQAAKPAKAEAAK